MSLPDPTEHDLRLSAEVIRYRHKRWVTPSGERVTAPLPAGVVGGFGPELRRFVLAAHIQRCAVEMARTLIWWVLRRSEGLDAETVRIFAYGPGMMGGKEPLHATTQRASYSGRGLGRLLARPHRRKDELLRVLRRPEIPLHTNDAENGIRACVAKRKIPGGTVSEAGRTARDTRPGLMMACAKLGVSCFRYLGGRLSVPDSPAVPPLPDLVRHATRA